MIRPHPRSTLFPYTTLFRSADSSLEERQEGRLSRGNEHGHVRCPLWWSYQIEPYFGDAASAHVQHVRGAIGQVYDAVSWYWRSEEHTSELQSPMYLVCRLLL